MLEANKLGVVAAYTKHVAFTLDGTEWTLRPLTDPFWKKEKKSQQIGKETTFSNAYLLLLLFGDGTAS